MVPLTSGIIHDHSGIIRSWLSGIIPSAIHTTVNTPQKPWWMYGMKSHSWDHTIGVWTGGWDDSLPTPFLLGHLAAAGYSLAKRDVPGISMWISSPAVSKDKGSVKENDRKPNLVPLKCRIQHVPATHTRPGSPTVIASQLPTLCDNGPANLHPGEDGGVARVATNGILMGSNDFNGI
jgi:hypothetical protein